ncbi:MAG TPA: nitronate monooxygenase family protein [Polyangiales bacterium]|nr:nitronate monooxygenase family protein [Polyangiales bacterium]
MPIPSSLQQGLRLPVVAAPMFLTSGPALVTACSQAGIIGTFPALNQRSTEGFREWLREITTALAASPNPAAYGVNLIVHKTNPRVAADLEVCAEFKVPLIITSLGAAKDVVERVHAYGGVVFHDVTTAKHARKAAEAGVDGLILVSAGAGGHAGAINPFALLHEVRSFFQGTILLAGALSTGSDVAAARMMGADFAYMGTRFIATQESYVSARYKEMLVEAGASDILYTPAISSIPANFLRQSIVEAGLDPEKLVAPPGIDLTHITEPYKKGPEEKAKAWRDVWSAGQGVGAIGDTPPAAELIERLISEYRAARASFQRDDARFE